MRTAHPRCARLAVQVIARRDVQWLTRLGESELAVWGAGAKPADSCFFAVDAAAAFAGASLSPRTLQKTIRSTNFACTSRCNSLSAPPSPHERTTHTAPPEVMTVSIMQRPATRCRGSGHASSLAQACSMRVYGCPRTLPAGRARLAAAPRSSACGAQRSDLWQQRPLEPAAEPIPSDANAGVPAEPIPPLKRLARSAALFAGSMAVCIAYTACVDRRSVALAAAAAPQQAAVMQAASGLDLQEAGASGAQGRSKGELHAFMRPRALGALHTAAGMHAPHQSINPP